mmetsp:Transcript_15098/g.25960  ORF Transcript_15098/g.25960 Transcript_15098/m.25960 type:complete len:258 (-) Transcript_15098:57-830(-)
MSKNAAQSQGRPKVFDSTVQGKLQNALGILKHRYTRDFPAFIKAVQVYQQKLNDLSAAGLKLGAELSRLGSNYNNPHGNAMARLGQQLSEIESVRNGLAGKLHEKFVMPMAKSLDTEKKRFSTNEKRDMKTIHNYEAELNRMVHNLRSEAKFGTNRMLENVAAITKKVQEFDGVNVEMLRELQSSQQKQFIQWSEHWFRATLAQRDYHVAMEQRLTKIKPLWSDVKGGEAVDTPAPEPKPAKVAPAPESKRDKKSKK